MEKGTNGLSEQDVFNIKQKYFGLNLPLGEIADRMQLKISQVMYAVLLNEETDIRFTDLDFETCRWILREGNIN